MGAYKTEAEVTEGGTVTLHDLPFPKGERVEVIVLQKITPQAASKDRYPLRGTAYRFEDAFSPAASEDEWEALK